MEQHYLQSVERTFSVVEQLAQKGAMRVREMGPATGLSITTAHRILRTLVKLGYVRQQEATEKYELTYKILALGHRVSSQNSVVQLVHPELEKLSKEVGETVHFVEQSGANIRYLDKILPNCGVVAMGSYIGMELPMYSTAVGKAILADMPESYARKIWEQSDIIQYTEHTISTWEELNRQLADARRTGCSFDREEREVGTFCVAVDILDVTRKPKYAVSISGPTARMHGEKLQKTVDLLLTYKKRLTCLIGDSI